MSDKETNQLKLISGSPEDTEKIGFLLADLFPYGTTVALYGDLAAGKTALSKAIFSGLHYKEQFSSPTYTIINEYTKPGAHAFHMDVYRLSESDELDYTGYDDCFEDAELIVIEWANLVESRLPHSKIVRIFLDRTDEDTERVLTVETDDSDLFALMKEKLHAYIGN
ncbi:MAG: tRNA (adenosine(37)-N6)-threonylcarbamoyltransferase complex ATPase subunit type 1 TsaE [Anaerofustis sp.]